MATGKKYYWLKLTGNFFKRHDIRIIKSQKNGKDYVIFYLTLLTESLDHNGYLRFNELIPYDPDMLSVVTDTDIDVVKSAIDLLERLKLIEILDDGTIFMTEVQRMVGSETDWARKKRIQRDGDIVPKLSPHSPFDVRQEIEKELEIEKDIEKDNKEDKSSMSVETDSSVSKSQKIDYFSITEYWNTHSLLKEITKITDTRKPNVNARVKEHGLEAVYRMIDNAGRSPFLRGDNDRGFMATFDWCFKPKNFTKVLEGNYIDKNYRDDKTIYEDIDSRVKRMNNYMGGNTQ